MRDDSPASRNSTVAAFSPCEPAIALVTAPASAARMIRGTSRGSIRRGMLAQVKIARRTSPAKAASSWSSPASTVSRVAEGEWFRIAPTRSTGAWSIAGWGRASIVRIIARPIRRRAGASIAPVIDIA